MISLFLYDQFFNINPCTPKYVSGKNRITFKNPSMLIFPSEVYIHHSPIIFSHGHFHMFLQIKVRESIINKYIKRETDIYNPYFFSFFSIFEICLT